MKHPRMSSGPFCVVRFLNDADGSVGTYAQIRADGGPVVLPSRSRLARARLAVVPSWRIGRGALRSPLASFARAA